MRLGITRWPGKGWIAHRSQQGWGRGRKDVVLGPLQVNWHLGLRVYVTWPMPVCVYRKAAV